MTPLHHLAVRWATLLLLGVGPLASAQHLHAAPAGAAPSAPTPEQVAFLEATHAALARFADPRDAAAAGFRPIGPDMPHMGQHWVHPGRAVSRTFRPDEPAMLTYLDVDGTPVLTGAAFTIPVAPGDVPPDFPYPGAWHAHAGRLMDEAFGLVPHGTRGADAPRLAMLHAWTEAPNPDGAFAADHWGLPFLRRGLSVPAHVPPSAGRAVALVSGYAPFFREAIRRAAAPSDSEARWLDATLTAHASRIEALLALGDADVAALARAWGDLWAEIERTGSASLVASLRPLFGTDGHTGTHAIAPPAEPAPHGEHRADAPRD